MERMPGARPQETQEHAPNHEHAKQGIDYLSELLTSEEFASEYVQTTVERAIKKDEAGSAAERELADEQKAIATEIKNRLKAKSAATENAALAIAREHGIEAETALDIKKQLRNPEVRKVWGPALNQAEEDLSSSNAEIEIDGQTYRYNEYESAVSEEVTQAHAESLAEKELALETIRGQFRAEAELHLEQLQQEVQERTGDPVLMDALDVWGMSPDSKGERGESGQGYHAGIAHFFEYRRGKDKLGRFNTEPTIDNFIEFSGTLAEAVKNPNPEQNPNIKNSVYIKDNQGQARLMILTNDDMMISAFKRKGEPMRIITAISPYQEKQFQKDIQKELNPKAYTKLNELGEEREQADISSYQA